MEEILKVKIQEAVKKIGFDAGSFTIEHPDEMEHGDFSTNVAMVLAKSANQNPRVLAEQIADAIKRDLPTQVAKIEVAGPGFINFFLSNKYFADNVAEILSAGKNFGKLDTRKGQKIIVEYSSPNIAKPFTIGHLRSTIIGDAIANILENASAKVTRDNHLGDWGTQFGKMIVAIKKWGDIKQIEKSKEPVKELVALYVKFNDEAEKDKTLDDEARSWFTKLEKKDREARKIWELCVKLSMKEFERIYKRLGISFDTYIGESFSEGKMDDVMKDVNKKGLAQKSEGATLIFFNQEKFPPLMLLKSDGSTLYALRDLATDKWRKKKYGKDVVIINEAGSEQILHFRQIIEVEKLLGYSNGADRYHVAHGLYRFKDGKMSTRKGNVIWLDEVLNEAVSRAGKFNPKVAEDVGIGAIKFNDLKREASREIVFDWADVLNLQGDSGPYLQYSFARANSVLEKAKKQPKSLRLSANDWLRKKIVPEDWQTTNLEKYLTRFEEVLEKSAKEFAPNHIANYLLELAGAFNSFYNQKQIVDDSPESSYKVALTESFSIVLKKGLGLLGIKAVKKM